MRDWDSPNRLCVRRYGGVDIDASHERAASGMSEGERELRRLRSEVAAQQRDIHDLDDREHRQETLIARLREEAAVREGDLAVLRERLEADEHELEDLRAIRDALTPPGLPQRPGLELAAAFLPAAAEQVSGDFYLVAEGPQDSTVLVVGDVVGHGLQAGRRAAVSITPDSTLGCIGRQVLVN